jgi:hypothetical protein
MLALNRSLLNREYILMIVLKALVLIIHMCNLHVILLSNNKPGYFTLFTNMIFHPFNVRIESRYISVSEADHLRLVFIDFNIPEFTPGRHSVEPTQDLALNVASLRSVAYRHVGGYH